MNVVEYRKPSNYSLVVSEDELQTIIAALGLLARSPDLNGHEQAKALKTQMYSQITTAGLYWD